MENKIFALILFFLFTFYELKSQTVTDSAAEVAGKDIIPAYPGGIKELSMLIKANLNQPSGKKRSGTVFVSFLIDTTGILTDFNIEKGLSKKHDLEAVRVVKLSSPWNPGMQKGKLVQVKYTLPITFR